MGNTGKKESWYKKQARLTKAPSFPEGDCNGNQPAKTLGSHNCFLVSKGKSFLYLEIIRQKLNKTHNLSFKPS